MSKIPLLLKAAPVSASVYQRVGEAIASFKMQAHRTPTLATVLVGEDPASHIYVKRKGEMCLKLGLGHKDYKFPCDLSQNSLLKTIRSLNADPEVDGILVQKPLPGSLDESVVFDAIDPSKDVDCFSPTNVGLLTQGRGKLLPCTPAGMLEILRHYKLEVAGKNALVIGRSDIVGKPIGLLLLHSHATVTFAHSKTADLASCIERADIVVAALGRARFLGKNLPWRKTAIVLDVGIHRTAEGKVVGDVEFEGVQSRVQAITPVPGGVGPMTIAMLMVNTVKAALLRTPLESGIVAKLS